MTVPRARLAELVLALLRQLIGDAGIARFGAGRLETTDVEAVLGTAIPSAAAVAGVIPQLMDQFFAQYGHTWQGKTYSPLAGPAHAKEWGLRTEDINSSRQYSADAENNDVAKLISNLLKLHRALQRKQ
ncbi:hypothetical protein [Sphaerisporangium siamense]|uniref:Uncharacterized protein n=1 Tax=Sphaerisporangium siamense TaxID=795645 RepID=A0A7W7DF04_9ACTN|nr:hypothetical protein [Sphaerisporangium siamense]MBB4705289.1 hypothetical protein [Sphaerisporangium siamense]